MDPLQFDGHSLNTANVIIHSIQHYNAPEREINLFQIVHGNRSKAGRPSYSSKKIILKGTIQAESIAAFDTFLDEFKGYFTGIEKFLDIPHAGAIRRYTATLTADDIPREGGLMHSEVTLQFTCSIPFGYDVTPTSLTSVTNATAAINNSTFTVGGNVEFQYPTISVTLNSGTNMTGKTISISNNNNGQVCSITRDWVAGDTIFLDPYFSIVQVNGIEVDFSGAIPIFSKGPGALSITDNFNTRSINYSASQVRYWL